LEGAAGSAGARLIDGQRLEADERGAGAPPRSGVGRRGDPESQAAIRHSCVIVIHESGVCVGT
jgi:hypothetical protein